MGFCQSQQGTSAPPVWADPLGPTSTGPRGVANYGTSGAPQIRGNLFNYMGGLAPQMNQSAQQLASGLTSAAGSSFYPSAQRFAENTMAGNYLAGSPQLDKAMAANQSQAMAGAADENARIKSDMGKSGMGMSTAYQQAAQGNTTAAAADAAVAAASTILSQTVKGDIAEDLLAKGISEAREKLN